MSLTASAPALSPASGPAAMASRSLAAFPRAASTSSAAISAGGLSSSFSLPRPSTSFPHAQSQERQRAASSPTFGAEPPGAAADSPVRLASSPSRLPDLPLSSSSSSSSSPRRATAMISSQELQVAAANSSSPEPRPPHLWTSTNPNYLRRPFRRPPSLLNIDDPRSDDSPPTKRRRFAAFRLLESSPSGDGELRGSQSNRGEATSTTTSTTTTSTTSRRRPSSPRAGGGSSPARAAPSQASPAAASTTLGARSLAGSFSSPRSGETLDLPAQGGPPRPPGPRPAQPPRPSSGAVSSRVEIIEFLGGDVSCMRPIFMRLDLGGQARARATPAHVVEACQKWGLTLLELESLVLPHWNLNCSFQSREIFFDFLNLRPAATPSMVGRTSSKSSIRETQSGVGPRALQSVQEAATDDENEESNDDEEDDNNNNNINNTNININNNNNNSNNSNNNDEEEDENDDEEDDDDDLPMMVPRGGRYRPRRPAANRLLGTLMGLEFQVDTTGLIYSSARWVQLLDGTILARLMTDARPTEIGGVDEAWCQDALQSIRSTVWCPELHWLFPRRAQQRLRFLAWLGKQLNLEPWWTLYVLPYLSGEFV